MKKQYTSNKEIIERLDILERRIMERLDKLEARNTLSSGVILLYSVAIALIIGYFSIDGPQGDLSLVLGILCYAFGFIIALRKNIKI